MLKTITTDRLHALRKSAEGFLLIDVSPKAAFDADHIPGARNVPIDVDDDAGFVAGVMLKASGSRTRKVVVYCAGPACDASSHGARLLVAAGFTSVLEYEDGLAGWATRKASAPRIAGKR